jgi:hypothetical protein
MYGSIVDGVLTLRSQGFVDLRALLTNLKQFISKSTQFLGISSYNTTITDKLLTLSTIVTTTNVAHFGLNLMFNIEAFSEDSPI